MPPIPPPTFSAWPATPQRLVDAPDVYITKADPWADHLPVASSEMEAAAANVYANAQTAHDASDAAEGFAASAEAAADAALAESPLAGTSNSTVTMSTGLKSVVLRESGKTIEGGRSYVLRRRGDPNTRLYGGAANWNAGTKTFDFTVVAGGVTNPEGGADYADWDVIPASYFASGATKADLWAGTRDDLGLTPVVFIEGQAFQVITEAEFVAGVNVANKGLNFYVTLTANRVAGAPTGMKDGVTYSWIIEQGGSGSYTWDWRRAGLPGLSTTVGKWDLITSQYFAAKTKLACGFTGAG